MIDRFYVRVIFIIVLHHVRWHCC